MVFIWLRYMLVLSCMTYSRAVTVVPISNQWDGGFQGDPCISITESLNGWRARLLFDGDVNLVEVWVATATKLTSRDFQLDNKDYNAILNSGDSLCFTFVARCDCTSAPTTTIYIEGMDDPSGSTGGSTSGSSGGSATNPPSSTSGTVVSVPISNWWNGGFQGEPCIDIYTTLNGWTAHLLFDGDVNTLEVWDATAIKLTSRDFQLDNKDYNADLNPGDKLCFTFVARCDCTSAATTTIYIEGNGGSSNGGGGGTSQATTVSPGGGTTSGGSGGSGTGSGTTSGGTGGSAGAKNYASALEKSILFYNAQRSGALPSNNQISWRGDSALGDCVTGGWYDAGDHVKFGLPMASSATLLLWSVDSFKSGYLSANQLDEMYDMIKWPLDYFLDAWNPTTNQLVVQVGDGNLDHAYWGRAEEMTMSRPCQTVSSGSKGSDVAGETAAALAVGSIVFKDKGDTSYGDELLSAAQSLYSFATSNRGIFYGASPFYTSSGDSDELCVAAVWLYRATGNSQYLTDAQNFATTNVAWALSWDNKNVACQILLYEETGNSAYEQAVVGFFSSWRSGGSVSYTPCGLAWRDQWGSNRYAGNAAFAALLAAEAGIEPATNRQWAVEQINYMLGDNNVNGGCFSFVVGYGSNYPQQPHHRGASCPDQPAPCGDAQQTDPDPNPQILQGALVGGPDVNGNYNDVRTDYIQNEVATDYNSGFQGAVAGIVQLESVNNLPATNNLCPCM